ncbi:hypothetical protein Q6325_29065, partial [Klebsiella pneumoniae]|nr:hypothetical protein [Klebsiella pneumoniae]
QVRAEIVSRYGEEAYTRGLTVTTTLRYAKQAAAQQARYLTRALLKAGDPGPYVYRDRGSLVSLGSEGGVGSLMGGLVGPNFL